MIENVSYRTDIQKLVAIHDQTFIASLGQALMANAFSNRMLIAPRRLAQIGQEEVANFFNFLQTQDTHLAVEHGNRLAREGLGHTTVLSMTSTLRRTSASVNAVTNDAVIKITELAESYTTALLEGYMSGREEELLQEQERTRNAFTRTQSY